LCAFTHDSSAALLIDGALVGFVEEERLSGIKHTRYFPRCAIDAVVSAAAIELANVQAVAYNFVPYRYLFGALGSVRFLLGSATRARALPRAATFVKVAGRTARRVRVLAEEFPRARVCPVLHHETHGLYAFAASGFEGSAVLVMDSLGENHTTALGYAEQRADRPSYRILRVLHDPASLGYAYGAVTEHLGFRRGDEEGTVMALAGLGDPARFRGLFARVIHVTADGFTLDPRLLLLRTLTHGCARTSVRFARATCPPRPPGAPIEQVRRDVAAALQERTEQVMLHLAELARRTTGAQRLCVGGGVATNGLSLGKIVEAGIFDEVFVPPAPGDAGTAIGAAAAVHLRGSTTPLSGIAGACYLGPAYPNLELAIRPRPGLCARRIDDPAPFLADQLAQGPNRRAVPGKGRGRAAGAGKPLHPRLPTAARRG
jgi:carbamoyltransferase